MRIAVLSQTDAERMCRNINTLSIAIISICSTYNKDIPRVFQTEQNKVVDILRLRFNDTENKSEKYKGISSEQSSKIVDFVIKYKDKVDIIAIHCYQGKSRSAGVAAAILEYLHNRGSDILNNSNYDANKLVYNTVLESFNSRR